MKELDSETVRGYIDRVGPGLGYDYTYPPVFPEGRRDVCAVNRMVENGSSYGFNIVYLVWVDSEGAMQVRRVTDTASSKDYLHITGVTAEGDCVTVHLHNGGSFSGRPQDTAYTFHI